MHDRSIFLQLVAHLLRSGTVTLAVIAVLSIRATEAESPISDTIIELR
jgi:hypothetical protein